MTIYTLIGISASGKTTLARTMVRYLNAVVIGRDPLRELLFGYTPETVKAYYDRSDFSILEKIISTNQDLLIKAALDAGQDVILDNTHLKLSYLNKLKDYGIPIKYVPVEIDFQTALERDASRERSVGEDVLRRQYEQLEHLKKVFDFKDWEPEPVERIVQEGRSSKADTIIFDIDGTLAINKGRSPFDWKRVGEDGLNVPVRTALNAFRETGHRIVICSGRDEVCRPETERWLRMHGIAYSSLYMRENNDTRKDSIVKAEFWEDIMKEHYIIAMVDDRKQVIDHARKLGFTVFDVAGNTF